ncbi:hypothetical protein NQZ79_g6758 [Umbelopsis isabellina]|nr:hypothetical protein NQZ79_g6758 [Umbelopsis isabellina]
MIPEDTPTRKRLKVVSACSECRRKKTKCNGEKPCHNCAKANVACEYPAATANDEKRNTSSKAAVEAIEDRLRTIEDMLKTIMKGGSQTGSNIDKDELMMLLKKETSSLHPSNNWESNHSTKSETSAEGGVQHSPSSSSQDSSLRLPSISELDKGYTESYTDTSSLARQHISRPLSYESTFPDPATTYHFQLPHASVQEYLYNVYFDVIYPLYPVVDKQDFLQIMSALPSHLDESNTDMCLNFMLAFTVLSCAAQVAPTGVLVPIVGTPDLPNTQLEPLMASDYFFDRATTLLNKHDAVTHPTMVTTMCLLALHYGRGDCRKIDKTCSFITRLNDMSIQLSLHMTPTENSSMSFRQRCLFWSVFTHDRLANLLYGRPMSIEEENIFVELTEPTEDTSDIQVFVEYVKLTRMLGRIMRHGHNSWQLSNLDRALHHWYKTLPKDLTLPQNYDQAPPALCILHLLFHVCILTLHTPMQFVEARKPSPATSLSASTSFGALNLGDVATPARTPSPPSSGLGPVPTSTIQAILAIAESFLEHNRQNWLHTNQLLHYALVALARSQYDYLQSDNGGWRADADQWLVKALELLKQIGVKPDSELGRVIWDIEQQISASRRKARSADGYKGLADKRSYESIDGSLPPSPHYCDDRKINNTQILLSPRMQSTTSLAAAVRNSTFGDEPKTFDFVPLIPRNGELCESRHSVSKFIHYTADKSDEEAPQSPTIFSRGSPPFARNIYTPEHTLKTVTSMPSLHDKHRYSRAYGKPHNSASSQLWDLATAAAMAER